MAKVLWKRLYENDFNGMMGSAAVSGTGGGARHIGLGKSKPGNDIYAFLPAGHGNRVTIHTEAGPHWPSATLTFSTNPARGDEWRIADQKNHRHPAWTAAAGFPTIFDPANPPVVLVLEIDGAYHVDWRDQRRLNAIAPSIAAADRGVAEAPAALVSELLFSPQLSPVDARVVNGQLRYIDTTRAEAASSELIVDSVRNAHLATAARLAEYLAGSNVGPGFGARFDAVHYLLGRTLTSERALQLAIHVRGLEVMMGAVAERLDDVTVADIAIFTADLIDLLNQLPAYRRFVEEARTAVTVHAQSVQAAAEVAGALEDQSDDLVEPQLKHVVGELRSVATETQEPLAVFGLVRTVGNFCRAVGRFFNERLMTLGRAATKEFDDTAGRAFGKAMKSLVVGSTVLAALRILKALFPGEFAFIEQLLNAARALFP
jgi:hypothetical protein